MILRRAAELRRAGVLGINARNRGYIMARNPRALYQLVDDKVRTKRLASQAKIAVPELYGLISTVRESRNFEHLIEGKKDFVVKPAHGSGGNGILVVEDRRRDLFIKSTGGALDGEDLRHHIANVLGGAYSLGGQVDQAIIEYRVKFDPVFNALSYRGVPDIRILVYRGIPAMAMLRLPTRKSDGKANLHQGAVGVGIHLSCGRTTLAVCNDRRIQEHPDFGTPLADHQIPAWDDLLLLSTRCFELAPLGYLGVDIVLDAELGPQVLELNARPGLAIQIANGCGLRPRLEAIDAIATWPEHAEDRAAIAKTLIDDAAR